MEEQKINIEEVLQEINKNLLNPELIKDNKLHFKVNEIVYRVRMPNQRQYSEAERIKNAYYVDLIQKATTDPENCKIRKEKDLIEDLKKTEIIDVVSQKEKIAQIDKDMMQTYFSMASLKDTDINAIKKLTEKIKSFENARHVLSMEIAQYIAPSLENQVEDKYMEYLTYLCCEIFDNKIDDKEEWKRTWNSFQDYEKDDTKVPLIALGRLTELMLNVNV